MEIFTEYNNGKFINKPVSVHLLALAIDPYYEYLNKSFYKANLKDKWNFCIRDFISTAKIMQNYAIIGIAHPARYTEELGILKYLYIEEIFKKFSQLNKKPVFVEGYYQSYEASGTKNKLKSEYKIYLKYINIIAKFHRLYRTGSTDSHGLSIFKYN